MIRNLINKSHKNSNIKEMFINDNTECDSGKIANAFNEFFTRIGSEISNSYISTNSGDISFSHQNSFFLSPTAPPEIENIIKALRKSKSDFDKLSVNILQKCRDILCYPISQMVNLSFTTGVFPSTLERAIVTPIFKSGDRRDMGNYRPISVLHSLSKIFERCMSSRILNFINKYSLISSKQFGFMKGKCTQDALLKFIELLYNNLNERRISTALFIDLRKAFDCVDHTTLLRKLGDMVFEG